MNETRYTAFISYSHEDAKWADWLQRSLESYRVPKHLLGDSPDQGPVPGSLAPIFRDRSELPVASDLSEVIKNALKQSRCLIVICSPAAARSDWVNREVVEFKKLNGEGRVFCLIVGGEPNVGARAGSDREECFVPALRFKIGSDGELSDNPAEPVAADVRAGKDSRADARLKIVAGMLGVGFDTVKQRDLHRSHQRLAVFASATTLGVLLTSGLAAYAFLAQREAETQRALAEDLVEFMVGDMRDRLEPIGQLNILDAIGDEVMQYFALIESNPADATMTGRHVRALRQIGEIRVQQGRPADGEEVFLRAMALVDEALRRNGSDEALLFEASQLHFWVADVHRRQLSLDLAEQHILRYLEISESLHDLRPENATYRMEVAYAYSNLGALAHQAGNTARAEELFGVALGLKESLAEDYPDNVGYRAELADTISWLGSVESRRGSLSVALAHYRRELDIRQQIVRMNSDPEQRFLLASAHRWVGRTLSAMDRVEVAIDPQLRALELYSDLVQYDEENFEWAQEYYWTLILLAKDQVRLGRLDDALRNLATAELRFETLGDDESDIVFPRLRAALRSGLGRYFLALGDNGQARDQALAALEQIEPHARSSDDYLVLIEYAEAAYVASEAVYGMSGFSDSADIASESLAVLDSFPEELPQLWAMKLLLAFNSGLEVRANEFLQLLADSSHAVRFVPGSRVGQWLVRSTSIETGN